MAEGIKNKVAIIGMGCTKFGEHWDRSAESLAVEAFEEAMADAGVEKKDIEAAWLSTCFDEVNVGKSAIPLRDQYARLLQALNRQMRVGHSIFVCNFK